jgi:hypothetical protein
MVYRTSKKEYLLPKRIGELQILATMSVQLYLLWQLMQKRIFKQFKLNL